MRKFANIILVILLVGCSIFTAEIAAEKAVSSNKKAAQQTTVTKVAATEKSTGKILLVENKKRDYHFYRLDNKIVMEHKGVDYEFENWSQYIDVEKPTLSFKKLDDDPVAKIILKGVYDINEDGSYVYGVYILSEIDNEDGSLKYTVNALTRASSKQIIDEMIKIEISQSPACDKLGFIAMNFRSDPIEYDRKTGVPQNGYYNCFHVLQDENGNFYKVAGWERGAAEYTVEDDGVYCSFPVTIKYKDTTEVQNIGFIKVMLSVKYKSYYVYVLPHSTSFRTNMETGAFVYDYEGSNWDSLWKNSNKSIGGDKKIDYINFDCNTDAELETTDFSKNHSDLNKLSGIAICEDKIMMYAKKGYSFDKDIIDKKEFSIFASKKKRNDTSYIYTYDISYVGSISKTKNGNEILTIKYEHPYDREFQKITINFGVK